MSHGALAPHDVARFLREHPPFDVLDETAVEHVAGSVQVESHPAGTTIITQDSGPVQYLRVVRSGAVEIVADGRVLDLLGEGELFGHASMLSGLPAGFEARAAEDTICYRIDADLARELLADPAGLEFVARSLLESPRPIEPPPRADPAEQPVRSLIRRPPVICAPGTPIRDAARRMTETGATSVVVPLENGTFGIFTDRDLRSRFVAAGLPADAPVSAAMSAPAYTCAPDRLGGEVLLEMLDRGFRHFPVVAGSGEILGVVEDLDVIAARASSPFFLRRRISAADSVDEVVAAAAELRPSVIAMHDARVAAANVMAVYAVVVDALTRRLLELALAEEDEPLGVPFAWLALGSQARREATPASDVDSAIMWFSGVPEETIRPRLHAIGERVVEGLEACGFPTDEHGVSASNVIFVRSAESWQRVVRSWIEDPAQEKALILTSVLLDSRPVWGVHSGTPVDDVFRSAHNPDLMRLLARFALSYRPPTGFFRGLVVDHSGEHRGRLDLKHGGVTPIVDLARWAGMSAGMTSASTVERLRAAAEADTLSAGDAHSLLDAFELITGLRVSHQVEQLRTGEPPDDYVDPGTLSPLMRSQLREAFRAVAAIQKRVAAEVNIHSA